ncbi:MAG: 60S ribosomal protein L15 [Paramarteilia canceri]
MGAASFQKMIWRNKQSEAVRYLQRLRTFELRQRENVHRVTKPSVPARAKSLGYKSKQGYVIYSIGVAKGTSKRDEKHGIIYGKIATQGIKKRRKALSHQAIAEQRIGRQFKSLRILNSYWVAEDGLKKYYEVICVDPMHNAIRNDTKINWICEGVSKHREMRGLTSATKKARGLGRGINFKQTIGGSKSAHMKKTQKISLRKRR